VSAERAPATRLRRLLAGAIALVTSGCALAPPPGVKPVTGFDLSRYLGTWYEIVRLDHTFERGLDNVSATYTLRSDGGVDVLNKGYNPAAKQWKQARGKAYFVGDTNTASLKVSFFGPFYGGYNVMALDKENYSYAMVCGPNTNYLWVLARAPDLPEGTLTRLLTQAAEAGFPTGSIIRVKHGM
jgi:apolipoprotein D and lipocalin family protein